MVRPSWSQNESQKGYEKIYFPCVEPPHVGGSAHKKDSFPIAPKMPQNIAIRNSLLRLYTPCAGGCIVKVLFSKYFTIIKQSTFPH